MEEQAAAQVQAAAGGGPEPQLEEAEDEASVHSHQQLVERLKAHMESYQLSQNKVAAVLQTYSSTVCLWLGRATATLSAVKMREFDGLVATYLSSEPAEGWVAQAQAAVQARWQRNEAFADAEADPDDDGPPRPKRKAATRPLSYRKAHEGLSGALRRKTVLPPPPGCFPPAVNACKYPLGRCMQSADGSSWTAEQERMEVSKNARGEWKGSNAWRFYWEYAGGGEGNGEQGEGQQEPMEEEEEDDNEEMGDGDGNGQPGMAVCPRCPGVAPGRCFHYGKPGHLQSRGGQILAVAVDGDGQRMAVCPRCPGVAPGRCFHYGKPGHLQFRGEVLDGDGDGGHHGGDHGGDPALERYPGGHYVDGCFELPPKHVDRKLWGGAFSQGWKVREAYAGALANTFNFQYVAPDGTRLRTIGECRDWGESTGGSGAAPPAKGRDQGVPVKDGMPLEDGSYAVSFLVAERYKGSGQARKRQFRVRWVGWPPDDDTWEDEDSILTSELIENFERLRDGGGLTTSVLDQVSYMHPPPDPHRARPPTALGPPPRSDPHCARTPPALGPESCHPLFALGFALLTTPLCSPTLLSRV